MAGWSPTRCAPVGHGAFGHALTVNGNTGHKAMSLYPANKGADGQSHIRFVSEVVYTNKPTSGAYRGTVCPRASSLSSATWNVSRISWVLIRSSSG